MQIVDDIANLYCDLNLNANWYKFNVNLSRISQCIQNGLIYIKKKTCDLNLNANWYKFNVNLSRTSQCIWNGLIYKKTKKNIWLFSFMKKICIRV